MARTDSRLEPAPKIPPLTALRIVSRIGGFVRPYRRQVVYAAIGLLFAAAAVLAMGQGLRLSSIAASSRATRLNWIECLRRCSR
jgi:hypothetical protein